MRFEQLLPLLAGGGGVFQIFPDQISGLYIWLVVDDLNGNADGANIGNWFSRVNSWEYRDPISGTGPTLIKNRVNGKSALRFNGGVGQTLNVQGSQPGWGGGGVTWACSWACAYRSPPLMLQTRMHGESTASTPRGTIFPPNSATARAVALYDAGTPTNLNISTAINNTSTPARDANWHIGIATRDTSGEHTYFHDGVDRTNPGQVNNQRAQNARRIFGNSDVVLADNLVEIAEFFCWDGVTLTDVEITGVYNYLALRYGFPPV